MIFPHARVEDDIVRFRYFLIAIGVQNDNFGSYVTSSDKNCDALYAVPNSDSNVSR